MDTTLHPFQTTSRVNYIEQDLPCTFQNVHLDNSNDQDFSEEMLLNNASMNSSPIYQIALSSNNQHIQSLFSNQDQRIYIQSIQQCYKELRKYTDKLQERNIDLVTQLQKERNKNQQYINLIHALKETDQEIKLNYETNMNNKNVVQSEVTKLTCQIRAYQRQIMEMKQQSKYLKELVMLANTNYQDLLLKNKELYQQIQDQRQQQTNKDVEIFEKQTQIKSLLSKLIEESKQAKIQKDNKKECQEPPSCKNSKKDVQQSYRKFFSKTLRGKENKKYS